MCLMHFWNRSEWCELRPWATWLEPHHPAETYLARDFRLEEIDRRSAGELVFQVVRAPAHV